MTNIRKPRVVSIRETLLMTTVFVINAVQERVQCITICDYVIVIFHLHPTLMCHKSHVLMTVFSVNPQRCPARLQMVDKGFYLDWGCHVAIWESYSWTILDVFCGGFHAK